MQPFAIQLYSVRDHWSKDPLATYKALKTAGYDHVELFGVGPQNAAEHKTMLNEAGLAPMCAHIDYETLTSEPEAAIEAARTLDVQYLVMPWLDVKKRSEWETAAERLGAIGFQFRRAGLHLGYHNHDHEFEDFDGRTAFEILTAVSRDNLFIELDAYWAEVAGVDPYDLIEALGQRCPLLHLKDRPNGGKVPFTEIGRGTTDWPRMFQTARRAGVRWLVVEQDESERDSLESAAISAEFMRSQLGA